MLNRMAKCLVRVSWTRNLTPPLPHSFLPPRDREEELMFYWLVHENRKWHLRTFFLSFCLSKKKTGFILFSFFVACRMVAPLHVGGADIGGKSWKIPASSTSFPLSLLSLSSWFSLVLLFSGWHPICCGVVEVALVRLIVLHTGGEPIPPRVADAGCRCGCAPSARQFDVAATFSRVVDGGGDSRTLRRRSIHD